MPQPIATSSIVSQAFRLMELGPISSFADDTPQARDAAEQYPVARRICLEACDWSFASAIADLPEVAASALRPASAALPFLYKVPGDCLKVREVVDPCVDWRIDGDYLRADRSGPLPIRYTADQENENRLPATFQLAVAHRLAAMLSPRWVGAANKAQLLAQLAQQMLKDAMRTDGRQASNSRYDGQTYDVDWVAEALR